MIRTALVLVVLVGAACAQELDFGKSKIDLGTIRRLPVLEGQRFKPFDSMAREWAERITGKEKYHGIDPVDFFLHLRFQPELARKAPLIRLPPAHLAKELGFSEISQEADHVSWDALNGNQAFRTRLQEATAKKEGARTGDDTDILRLANRWRTFGAIAGLEGGFANGAEHRRGWMPFVAPSEIPKPGQIYEWLSPVELDHGGHPPEKIKPIDDALAATREAWIKDDAAAFATASKSLLDAAAALGYPAVEGFAFPGMERMDREIRLNLASPFRRAMWIYFTAFLLGLLSTVFPKSRILWYATLLAALGGLSYHAYGTYERTLLSGRAMIGTFYESMLYVSGAAALLGIIFELIFKNRWCNLAGSFIAVMLVWVAITNPDYMQPAISNLRPVLINNDWIHIHVPTIMTSYSMLGMAALLGELYLVFYVFRGARAASQQSLAKTMFWVIPVGSILAIAGIILGGIWADDSWGRFWGWDPKEVGALIMWLVFMVVIHGRWTGWLRDFGTAAGCVVGGWSLIWSYWGTNHFWTGLHSYAGTSNSTDIPTWLIVATIAQVAIFVPAILRWAKDRGNEPAVVADPPAASPPAKSGAAKGGRAPA